MGAALSRWGAHKKPAGGWASTTGLSSSSFLGRREGGTAREGLGSPLPPRPDTGTLADQWGDGRARAATDLFNVESFHLKGQVFDRSPGDFRRGELLKVPENRR